MKVSVRCPVCRGLGEFYPATVRTEWVEMGGRKVRRRTFKLAITCSLYGSRHWNQIVGTRELEARKMRRLLTRMRQEIRSLFEPANLPLPENAIVHAPSWYQDSEAVAVEVAEGEAPFFTESDWERLRETVEKDVLPFHVEEPEPMTMPAGSIVILRTGELGVTTGGFRVRDAEALDFSEMIGSDLTRPKDVERDEEGEVASTLEALTYAGRHEDEVYIGGHGLEHRFVDPIGVRILQPPGVRGRRSTRVGLEEVAWILESDDDRHMKAFLELVGLYLEGDARALKVVEILAQHPAWMVAREVERRMRRLVSAHVEEDRLVLVYSDGSVVTQPLEEKGPEPKAAQEAGPVQMELPLETPVPTAVQEAPAAAAKASARPDGPHVVIVVDNKVVRWAPFRPIMHRNGRSFSVDPRDENVRKLAELCRTLRQKGEPAELRYVLEGVTR